MDYSISDVSKMLKKSKTAIYDKLNSNKHIFKQFLSVKQGSKHLNKEGFDILCSMFNEVNFKADLKVENHDENNISFKSTMDNSLELINTYKKQVELLENQLESLKKDKAFLQNQLLIKDRLLEQSNILLLNEQRKKKKNLWQKLLEKINHNTE
jgi:hypothetical protein